MFRNFRTPTTMTVMVAIVCSGLAVMFMGAGILMLLVIP